MKLQQGCIICGSPVFAENLCEKCFLERNDLFKVQEKIEMKHCTNCGSYHDAGWKQNNLEQILKSKISSKNKLTKTELRIGRGHVTFLVKGYIRPSKKIKSEQKTSVLKIERRKCEDCIKLLSGYYQAVFQIRGPNSEKILKKVLSLAGTDATVLKEKHGYDVRFLDKSTAFSMSRFLTGLNIKKSYKLITEKKGKKLYRDFYAIR